MDWDERFRRALAEGAPPDPPADWLLAHSGLLAGRAPGRAADVACGLGRHTILLAELGFAVDAVDASRVALDHVEAVAHVRGLPIEVVHADLRAAPALPRPPYAAVVMVNYLQRELFEVLVDGLEPGGLLAVETFLAQPGAEWGPSDPARVVAPGELEVLLAGTELVFVEEAPHRGRVKARAIARRAPS